LGHRRSPAPYAAANGRRTARGFVAAELLDRTVDLVSSGEQVTVLDMGVEPYALTSGIRGVLNQRLVRKTCIACSGKGCDACNHSGFAGRLLLAELIEVKGALRKAILARADLDGLLDAAKLDAIGGESGESELWAAGLRALVRGETTLAELTRVLGPKPTQLVTDSISKTVKMSQHNQNEQGTGA
jgi:hypothetical protein